jgi:hypothetical protein
MNTYDFPELLKLQKGDFFVSSNLVKLPFPYRSCGQEYTRSSNGESITFSCPLDVPYGKMIRIVTMLITTTAKQQNTRHIEFSSVSSTLKKLGSPVNGSQIQRLTETLLQLDSLKITFDYVENDIRKRDTLSLTERAHIIWNSDNSTPKHRDSWLLLTESGLNFLAASAVPVIMSDVISMKSPREIDLYTWLIRRLYTIRSNTPVMVPWVRLYDQFGPVPSYYRPQFKKEITAYLIDIKQNYYPGARVELCDNGLILRESKPLIVQTKPCSFLPCGVDATED